MSVNNETTAFSHTHAMVEMKGRYRKTLST